MEEAEEEARGASRRPERQLERKECPLVEWMAAGAGGRDDYGDDNEEDCSRGCCHSHLQDGLQLLQLGLLLLDLAVVVLEQLQQQEPSDVQHLLHTREEEGALFQLSVEEADSGSRPL